MTRSFMMAVIAVSLIGCATIKPPEYQPINSENRFGYKEAQQEDGSYILSVILPVIGANNDLPFQFWDRRAAELCGSESYEKNIYKAVRPTVVTQGAYVYGSAGTGGGSAGNFVLEGKLNCDSPSDASSPE